MTERTTPITVHLTDEQMDDAIENRSLALPVFVQFLDAIFTQRPRPIAVGDRVIKGRDGGRVLTVEALKGGFAWTWNDDGPWTTYSVDSLTRVDRGAQP